MAPCCVKVLCTLVIMFFRSALIVQSTAAKQFFLVHMLYLDHSCILFLSYQLEVFTSEFVCMY